MTNALHELISAADRDGSGALAGILEPLFVLLREPSLHATLVQALKGGDSEVLGQLGAIRLATAEWDINPEEAGEAILRALQSPDASGEG